MASSLNTSQGIPETGNRRASPRERLGGFVLVFFEGDRWGKLVNLSPGGMTFEFTQPPPVRQPFTFTVEVLGLNTAQYQSSIQTEGRVVWTNERDNTAGVQFTNLSENAHRKIKQWLFFRSPSVIEDASPVQHEILAGIKEHLRECLNGPVTMPGPAISTASLTTSDDSLASAATVPFVEPISEEPAPAVILSADTIVQESETSSPSRVATSPSTVEDFQVTPLNTESGADSTEEIPFLELVGTSAPEPPMAQAQIEPLAEAAPAEAAAETAAPKPIAESTPLEMASSNLEAVLREQGIPLPSSELSNAIIEETQAPEFVQFSESEARVSSAVPVEVIAASKPPESPAEAHHEQAILQDGLHAKPEPDLYVASEPEVATVTEPAEANLRTPVPLVSRPGQGKPNSADAFAVSASSATKSGHANFTQSIPAQKTPAKQTDLDRLLVFCLVGCFVLLSVLGLGIMMSQANRLALTALLENIRKPFIFKTSPPQPKPNAALQPFQIEVVDINNRRWLLNFGSPATSADPVAPAHKPTASAPVSAAKPSRPSISNAPANLPPQPNSKPEMPNATAPSLNPATDTVPPPLDSNGAPASAINQPAPEASANLETKAPDANVKPAQDISNETAAGAAGQPAQPASQPAAQPSQPIAESGTDPAAQSRTAATKIPTASSPNRPVQSAILIASVPPNYPASARTAKTQGDVVVDALIDETGHVANMKVLSGPSVLRQAARDSLLQWKYRPALLHGQPVPTHIQVTVKFRIN